MGRLSLVIADYDADYLQNFEKYLITYHPKRFELTSFSAAGPLNAYLGELHKIDILLVNSKMYREIINTGYQEIVLILSENESITQAGLVAVSKYQHMDKLISEVIRLYTLGSRKDCPVSGNDGTRIVSVVSPAGGTGKSCIAAGCSILCAGRGMRGFYLNLEDIQSTEMFFHGDSKQSFSNVIYQLKGSSPNLWLKLEAARCIDSGTGVHFFRPAENILDMNELSEQEISKLLFEFRKSSAYNAVFIDLPTGLNERNSSVLKYSDAVILVLTQDFRIENNTDKFSKGLEMIENKLRADLIGRIVPVLNFSRRQKNSGSIFGYRPIAEISDHSRPSDSKSFIKPVENPAFLAELNKVINYILPGKNPADSSRDGIKALWDGSEVSGSGMTALRGVAVASEDRTAASMERAAVSGSGAVALGGGAAATGNGSVPLWDGGEFIV